VVESVLMHEPVGALASAAMAEHERPFRSDAPFAVR
jgi:hypothetical protein